MRAALLLLVLGIPVAADASFHFMKIREVYAGADAQYVMIQMYEGGQNFVGGHYVTIFNAAGTLVQTNTFPGSVDNGADEATILVGTATTQSVFGVAPDLVMPAATMSAAGGKACFDAIPEDCIAWGSYTGSATGVGAPAAPGGIPDGYALRRDVSAAGGVTTLDAADDTDVSADDFDLVTPEPRNNAGEGPGTTTTTLGGGGTTSTTTTTPGASTTTTTLDCAATGPDGARCVIGGYPPSACGGEKVPGKVGNAVAAADRLLEKALGASSTGRARRFQKRAAARLLRASRAAAKAGTRGKIAEACAAAIAELADDARARVLATLP